MCRGSSVKEAFRACSVHFQNVDGMRAETVSKAEEEEAQAQKNSGY